MPDPAMQAIANAIQDLEQAHRLILKAKAAYEAGKDGLLKAPIEVMARAFIRLDQAHDEVEAARCDFNKELEHMSRGHIPDRLLLAGVPNITVTVGNRDYLVSKGARWSASMVDKEGAISYLKAGDENMRALVKEEVNAKTLASFAKDYTLTYGKELPEGLFKVGTVPYTMVRVKSK